MATKKVKLSELKVSELKKELEERDLTLQGSSVLQQRLKQALLEAGEDPDVFLFDIDGGISDFAKILEQKFRGEFSTTSRTLETKLEENSRTLGDEIRRKF